MNRMLIGGVAVLLLAGGVIAMATAAAMWGRDRQTTDGNFESEVDIDFASTPTPTGADADWLTRYTLTDQKGKTFESEGLAGEVHVVSFFFSACPSTCWLQNQQVGNMQREFGDDGVQFVSITCDPAKDTPSVLSEYAAKLNAKSGWWFLTSPDLTYLKRIAAEVYSVSLDKQTHSSRLLLIDRSGKIRETCHYNEPEPMKQFKAEIRKCLGETVAELEAAANTDQEDPATAAEEPPFPE